MMNECFVCGDKYKERGDKLELAHMLSVNLARIIVLAQFNGGVKLQGDEEHVAFNKIIAKTRDRKKGDVWLCHRHHMYSDKQQRKMVVLLKNGLKTNKQLIEDHQMLLEKNIVDNKDDLIKKQEVIIEYLENRIREVDAKKEDETKRDVAKEKALEKKYGGRPY